MEKEKARRKVAELVEKYERVKRSGRIKTYTEAETCKDFILPLFKALGWNTEDKSEVSAEEHTSSKDRSDYGFYLNTWPKFYLEAKRLSADLHDERFAKQATTYSWNKGIAWAVLTDFENLIVFNAQDIAEHLSHKLFFDIPYSQYLERFDQLWWLSRESFEKNILDEEAEKVGKKLQRVSVTETLYKDLNESRKKLLKSFHAWNPEVDYLLLEEGIQRLLDRLIFIRVAEDRKLEPPTLIPMLRAHGGSSNKDFYRSLMSKFRELDEIYDSNLFELHPLENWEEYDGVTEDVIELLHGQPGYYEYNFEAIPADILGSVYENYLGYRLAQSDKGLEVSEDARKRKDQGIYYTPPYIVDYIVANALKPVLDKCDTVQELKRIKVLDPACGSGSFLIRAMEMIYEKYLELGAAPGELTKITILLDNIFGVDLDEQAVEIARLNLLINALDSRMKLPDLSGNIQNGNSLISGDDKELEESFGEDFRDKKPFNWSERFPQVFNRDKPGFDVIIGNPPWVSFGLRGSGKLTKAESDYFRQKFPRSAEYKISVYALFMELGVKLTSVDGQFSFIVPDSFLLGQYFSKIRDYLLEDSRLSQLMLLKYKVFEQGVAGAYVIFVLESKKSSKILNIIVSSIDQFDVAKKGISIPRDYYLRLRLNRLRLFKSERDLNIVSLIERDKVPLRKYIEFNSGLISKNGQANIVSDQPKDSFWLPGITSGGEILRFYIKDSHSYLYYKKEAIKSGYSNIDYTLPKLFLRQTGDAIISAVDEKGLLALNNVHIGSPTPRASDKTTLNFIVAVLNSNLINFYYKLISLEEGRTMAQIDIETIDDMPMPDIDETSIEKINELSALALKLGKLQKSLINEVENSEKWKVTKSEIENADRQINKLVYKLYNLTPEEVEIAENKESNAKYC